MVEQYLINEKETKEGLERMTKVIKRLVSDSQLCIENGRYASSVSISILVIEECAKADYFRLKIKDGKGITKKEWEDLTAGGKSHITKLKWFLEKKEKRLEEWTQTDMKALNQINKKFGFGDLSENKEQIKQEIKFFKTLIPKFNLIKQSCFYTSWDIKNKKWTYFDNIFSDKIKIMITYLLFLEAKRNYLSLLFIQELPTKKFAEYTKDDWDKAMASKTRKEIFDTYQVFNKKIGNNFNLVMKAISSIN